MANLVKATPRNMLPEIDLITEVTHNGANLDVALFGRGTYNANLGKIGKLYYHSPERSEVSFRPATTAESLSASVQHPNIKSAVLDPSWFQAGYIVRTSEGVWFNPPKDSEGNQITDEQILGQYRNKSKNVGGIWLLPNTGLLGPDGKPIRDFGFAPYETFGEREQSVEEFAKSGLARALEHTEVTTANYLGSIASKKNYPLGVLLWGFEPTNAPCLRVASLYSDWDSDGGGLSVDGDGWNGYSDGYAFGVRESGEASAQKI